MARPPKRFRMGQALPVLEDEGLQSEQEEFDRRRKAVRELSRRTNAGPRAEETGSPPPDKS